MTRWFAVASSILSFMVLPCCGGGGGSGEPGQDTVGDMSVADLSEDIAQQETADEPLPTCVDTWVLEFFGIEDNMTVEATRTYSIQARMYNSATQSFIAGETVSYALEGDGDGTLLATEGTTDVNGVASVVFDAGTDESASYTITISNRCTQDVVIHLQTVPPEKGTFVITVVISPELQALSSDLDITLYLENAIPICGGFDFTNPSGVAVPLSAGQNVIEFADALSSSAYLVTGVALDNKGLPIGGGCTENAYVMPDRTEEITVTLYPLDLNPVGSYDATLSADVHSLIPEEMRDPGGELYDLLDNAGTLITQRIVDDLLAYFPEGLPTVCNENTVDIPKEILDSVTLGLGQDFPPAPFATIRDESAGLLAQMFGDVEFRITFTVQPKQALSYPAKLHVTEIALGGNLPCGAECSDLLTLPFDSFTGGEVVLDLEDVETTLTTSNLELWTLPEYEVTIRPGKLFMLAFVRSILPAYGLADSIQDALEPLFNCETLVAGVGFQTTTCLNKNPQFLAESCVQAVSDIRLEFYNRFGALLADQVLKGVFSGTMKDPNNDLKAEALEGTFVGNFMLSTGGVLTSQGTFNWPIAADKANL